MEQLLSMGFSHEQATQALAATAASSSFPSVDAAADWILSHQSQSQSQSPTIQPSLDRFFPLSKATPSPSPPPPSKRPKPSSLPLSPLADRMRPSSLDLILGQDHLLGPTSLLRSSLSLHRLPSLLLWGPPGSGKTSLARALSSSCRFLPLSAVTAGVRDVRDAVDAARRHRRDGVPTVLFVDEVHRFNRAQQDSLLPAVEDGSVAFVGATTENPSFHVTTPLLSRCHVLRLQPLGPPDVAALLRRAADDPDKGLILTTRTPVSIDDETVDFLSLHCDGDARVALNALEAAAMLATDRGSTKVGILDAKDAMQCKHLAYDRAGEEHYNLISALHKSMRGSDPDAAIYWLARMLEGGEQPLYIARRLVRFASEDVGLADPAAAGHAVACYQACHFLGMPECDVNLAQCVAYLALAPKSVAVYRALGEAKRVVKESKGGNEGVPLHLRNAPTKLMKEMGYGQGYIYPPDHPGCSALQTYLPPSLQGHKFLDWPPHEEKPQ